MGRRLAAGFKMSACEQNTGCLFMVAMDATRPTRLIRRAWQTLSPPGQGPPIPPPAPRKVPGRSCGYVLPCRAFRASETLLSRYPPQLGDKPVGKERLLAPAQVRRRWHKAPAPLRREALRG